MKTRMTVVQLINTHIPTLYARNVEVVLVLNKEAISVDISYYQDDEMITLPILILDKNKEDKLRFLAELLYLIENEEDTGKILKEAISRYFKQHVI